MKAERRKEIETNSLVLLVQRWRQHVSSRSLYYLVGTVALVIAIVFLWRYLAGENRRARDAILVELQTADTTEKLREGMDRHRGTIWGSFFKAQLARRRLRVDGLPQLGADRDEARDQAAAAVAEGRKYFLELTTDLKDQDEPGLVQEAWYSAAEAEEALVGMPTKLEGTDSRGDADKAIEYFDQAANIFPDTDLSKGYKKRADDLRANKTQFINTQRALYQRREPFLPSKPPEPPKAEGKTGPDVPAPILPPDPGVPDPKSVDPKAPKAPEPKSGEPKTADPKKEGEAPKPPEPKPADPKKQ
ncbi:MAG TPA: hypothetical protein VKE40_14070 [Gemmataceae bacterium]|nr:hypothetical protein [Gemmataceae bacterium]